jgi:cell wall-associated NlpC family hydrolase
MTLATDAGPRAVVAAAAPLWASADDAREIAPFGESSYAAFRAWAAGRLPDQKPLHGRLHTVATSGEPLRVIAEAGPSLVEVELLAQPNGDGGYVGVMHAAHVGADARREATHVVAAGGALAATADGDAAPLELAAGTTVELLGGPEAGDAAEVVLASGATVRCPTAALRPLGPPLGAAELFAIATGFGGVPYLWGGVEDAGIDCSGLVHLAARIGGHVVPRDAHHQWAATRIDIDADELEVGDLLYFGEEASLEGIDHVGLYAGDGRMLHAPEAGRTVVLEPLSARARERTVGFGRYPTR